MVITYHGGEFFKVAFGDIVIALNPISKDSKWKTTRFGADIAIVSLNHPDFNGIEQVSRGEKQPFAITGPGEYERSGVFIRGFPVRNTYKDVVMINTIYTIELEGMHIVFLGALGGEKSGSEIVGELPSADVLFTPIGGGDVLSSTEAHELMVRLEAKVVIPMHYGEDANDKGSLQTFLKLDGGTGKPIEKLTLKKKDLAEKSSEIVVFKE